MFTNVICLPTEHQRALKEQVKRWPYIPSQIGTVFGNGVFVEEGKPEYCRKTFGAVTRTNNKVSSSVIESSVS